VEAHVEDETVPDNKAIDTTADALFSRLAPVLNVTDLAAERDFYERLGFPVSYEGPEYPMFIAFGTDSIHFGIQEASTQNLQACSPGRSLSPTWTSRWSAAEPRQWTSSLSRTIRRQAGAIGS
jgi:catechol 2,3-dioxygenase-like lactoylglutathione lyase family enzyme